MKVGKGSFLWEAEGDFPGFSGVGLVKFQLRRRLPPWPLAPHSSPREDR